MDTTVCSRLLGAQLPSGSRNAKIQDLFLKLEGFTFVTSSYLNMGYYYIKINPCSSNMCTIVLPWDKYEYNKLPKGLCNSPDIFQEKMSEFFTYSAMYERT